MKLIEALEREGGHIIVLLALVLLCLALAYGGVASTLIEKCGDLSLGALLLAMKGSGNKKPDPAAQPDADRTNEREPTIPKPN